MELRQGDCRFRLVPATRLAEHGASGAGGWNAHHRQAGAHRQGRTDAVRHLRRWPWTDRDGTFPDVHRARGHVLFDQGPFLFRGKVEEEFGAVTVTVTHLDRLDRMPQQGQTPMNYDALFSAPCWLLAPRLPGSLAEPRGPGHPAAPPAHGERHIAFEYGGDSGSSRRRAARPDGSPALPRWRPIPSSLPMDAPWRSPPTGAAIATSTSCRSKAATPASSPGIPATTTPEGWSPDGKLVLFASNRKHRPDFLCPAVDRAGRGRHRTAGPRADGLGHLVARRGASCTTG